MIELKNVTVKKGKKTVLDQVNLKLSNGNIYGIFCALEQGDTLMSLFSGELLPSSGAVLINGFDTAREWSKARELTAYMPREDFLYPNMTPLEYLLFVADARGFEYQDAIRKVANILGISELSLKRNILIKHLSPQDKCTLSMVQAFLSKAQFIILNIPFGILTYRHISFLKEVLAYCAKDKTVIVRSSQKDSLHLFCHRVFSFENNTFTELTAATVQNSVEEEETV